MKRLKFACGGCKFTFAGGEWFLEWIVLVCCAFTNVNTHHPQKYLVALVDIG